jgi:hypothetical protein
MTFTEPEIVTVSNALRIAAEHFRGSVEQFAGIPNHIRLAEQCALQADLADRLHERIAEETGILT